MRRWGAISCLAATLEQKVWVDPGDVLYPNLYVFLVGDAAVGKSRVINNITLRLYKSLPDSRLGPSAMSKAAMTDVMASDEHKRVLLYPTDEYHTMYAGIDELTFLMSKWDTDIVAGLTKYYDCTEFKEAKRMEALRHHIERPQMNLITGCTPESLLNVIPPTSWGQGFMSRVILIYGVKNARKQLGGARREDFEQMENDLVHDLLIINTIRGRIPWSDEYAKDYDTWGNNGCQPVPQHPYLKDYSARREAHLLKLSMVACADRGGAVELQAVDLRRALGWMVEAERVMPEIFAAGMATPDSRAHDEIEDFVRRQGKPVSQQKLVRFVSQRVRTQEILRTIDVMIHGGRLVRSEDEPWTFTPGGTKQQ